MASVRRVVTGFDADGRSVVMHDDVQGGEDQWTALIWATETVPVDLDDPRDGASLGSGSPLASLCRYSEIPPGFDSRMHRTATLDFGIILEGEIEMPLDNGETVTLRAGDVLVQRGTSHAWANRSDAPCRIFWAMVEAAPVVIDGQPLEITGR
jgi:mannose-6-phosphate isomerase-like protein (cupin superfamily)